MLFSGHAEGKLDPSGRIQISSQFKNEPDKLTLVVFTDSDAGCVKIYTEEGNRKSQEQLYRNISDRLTFVSAISLHQWFQYLRHLYAAECTQHAL